MNAQFNIIIIIVENGEWIVSYVLIKWQMRVFDCSWGSNWLIVQFHRPRTWPFFHRSIDLFFARDKSLVDDILVRSTLYLPSDRMAIYAACDKMLISADVDETEWKGKGRDLSVFTVERLNDLRFCIHNLHASDSAGADSARNKNFVVYFYELLCGPRNCCAADKWTHHAPTFFEVFDHFCAGDTLEWEYDPKIHYFCWIDVFERKICIIESRFLDVVQ